MNSVLIPKPGLKPNTAAFETEPLIAETGFREYDARWLFPQDINLIGVQALGLALGTYFHERGVELKVVVGHDFRSYSLSIKQALTLGLMSAGCAAKTLAPAKPSAITITTQRNNLLCLPGLMEQIRLMNFMPILTHGLQKRDFFNFRLNVLQILSFLVIDGV